MFSFPFFLSLFLKLVIDIEIVPVKRPQLKVTQKIEKVANVSINKVLEPPIDVPIVTAADNIEKKIKPTHPRIKYSRHKNPTFIATQQQQQQQLQQQSQLHHPVRTQLLPDGKKIEFISVTTVKQPDPVVKQINIPSQNNSTHQFIIQVPENSSQNVTEYQVSATHQSNDFPNEIIDELDYSGIDDIELPEDVQIHFSDSYKSEDGDGKKFSYEMSEENSMEDGDDDEPGKQYECRHCGKRYRWKSTLRRHESVECGGKEASHECPYCNYKAKQRGNLGVHIRKHHQDKPPLETRRKSTKPLHTR